MNNKNQTSKINKINFIKIYKVSNCNKIHLKLYNHQQRNINKNKICLNFNNRGQTF